MPPRPRRPGFSIGVVDEDRLDEEVAELVATLVRMPKLALLSTKAHTNAVTESMVSTGRSWADAEACWRAYATPRAAPPPPTTSPSPLQAPLLTRVSRDVRGRVTISSHRPAKFVTTSASSGTVGIRSSRS